MSKTTRTNTTEKAVALLKAYGRYIVDHAESMVGDVDPPNYVTEDCLRVSFTLADYNSVPTVEVTKEYIVIDALEVGR